MTANAAPLALAPMVRERPVADHTEPLDRLYKLSELSAAGWGDRRTITKLINNGTLPAMKIGNSFRIRERDLDLLRELRGLEPVASTSGRTFPALNDSLGDYVKALVDTFPKLDAEHKAELGRLLRPAA